MALTMVSALVKAFALVIVITLYNSDLVQAECEMWDASGYIGTRPLDSAPISATRLSCTGVTSFSRRLFKLSALTSLTMTDSDFKKIPKNIKRLKLLTSMTMSNCNIQKLHSNIGTLDKLAYLDLQDNSLSALPSKMGSMSSLTYLDASSNLLTGLPKKLTNLNPLLKLNLGSNQLSNLQYLSGLVNLNELSLDHNDIVSLPTFLKTFSSLTSLDVSSNALTELPDNFGLLTQLETLDVSDNKLGELPESLGLSSLEELSIRENLFSEFPSVIANMTSLKELAVDNNTIAEIPDWINVLSDLVYLTLGSNQVDPDSLLLLSDLSTLRTLSVDNNDLQYVPDGFGENLSSLRFLDIRNNSLQTLPSSMETLSLDYLLALPNEFCGELPNIQVAISSDLSDVEFDACSSTEAPTTSRTPDEECFVADMRYYGTYTSGVSKYVEASSAIACLNLCESYGGCNYMSYFGRKNQCYLFESIKKTRYPKSKYEWVSSEYPCPTPSPTLSPTT